MKWWRPPASLVFCLETLRKCRFRPPYWITAERKCPGTELASWRHVGKRCQHLLFARREFWIAVYQFGALVVVARIFPDVHKAIGLRRIPFAGNERPEAKKRRQIWEDRKVEALEVAAHSVHPAFARRTSEAWVLTPFPRLYRNKRLPVFLIPLRRYERVGIVSFLSGHAILVQREQPQSSKTRRRVSHFVLEIDVIYGNYA